VDGVQEAHIDKQETFLAVPPEAIEEIVRSSLDGFRGGGPVVTSVFVVREADAAWVQRNLLKGMTHETLPTGELRVEVTTSAVERVARFVVGLGDVARPESAELCAAVVRLARAALAAADAAGHRSQE